MNSSLASHFLAYMRERYEDCFEGDIDEIAARYAAYCEKHGRELYDFGFGFFSYEPKGDALIVWDIFIAASMRSKAVSYEVFKLIPELAEQLGKSVIIGQKDDAGATEAEGDRAMRRQGFVPYLKLENSSCYLRGVY